MSRTLAPSWLKRLLAEPRPASGCRTCRHFANDGAALEAAFPNLASMSSGYGSVRVADGICGLRGIYLPATAACGSYAGPA